MIENIPLPRLLNASGGTERRIHPTQVSINLNITPLSDASMTLPKGENLPTRGYVELFTCMGSAGIYRVRSPQDSYGQDNTTAELEHAIVEVGDFLVLHKYDEMMAASTAMQTVFSHYRGTKWQLGSVSALGNTQIALQVNYDKVLEAMLAILDQKTDCMMAFDFTTTPWTVNIVAKGTTVTAEGRLSRNVNYARVVYDDTELCTVAYYEKPKANQSATADMETEWLYLEADTKNTYGPIEREVKTGDNFTPEEALRIATTYLNEHKNPRVSVEIGADELSSITGESFDQFTIGKLFRLVLVDYGLLPIEKVITGLTFPDVYGSPRNITVHLDQEEDTLVRFIHDMDSKGGSVGGGGSRKKQDDNKKRTYTEWVNTDNMIGMIVGIEEDGYKIKGGEITLAINEDGGTTAKLGADTIDIDGVVSKLETYSLQVVDFNAADGEFTGELKVTGGPIIGYDYVQGTTGKFTGLNINGDGATWQSYQARFCSLSNAHYYMYAASHGGTTPSGTNSGRLVSSYTDTTIHYLGGAST